MPELSDKANPSATAGSVDSSAVDREQTLFEVEEAEEVDEMEEGEDGSDGEEEEDGEDEEEDVEEVEEEEDVGGDGEGEDADEMEDDGTDQEHEVVYEVEEVEVEDCEDNEDQETEEVEEEVVVEEEIVEEEVVEEEEEVVEEEEDGDGGEEEIEVEENVEEEEEGRRKGLEESGASSAEAVITVQEDAKDLCMTGKLDVHSKDQNSVSTMDQNVEKLHANNSSKIFSTYGNELNDASVSNDSSSLVKNICAEESGISDTLLGKTCKSIQIKKEISNEAPEHVKNICLEPHGNHSSLQSDNVRSCQLLKNDLAVEAGVKNEPEIVKYDVSEKVESRLDGKTDTEMLENSIPTRGLTPRRRTRSPSPGSDPDRLNKRIGSVCVFYARGWCIKGKSCKFLHQKDGDNIAELQSIEGSTGYNKKSDNLCITGTEDAVEGAKVSSAPLDSNPEILLGSSSLLNRALVRTYGTGNHVPSHPHERYDMPTRGEFRKPGHFQPGCTSTQEEYKKPFGKMSYFESVLERQSDDTFLSRRRMIDGKLLNEISREDSPYETTISRTHIVDAFAPESKHYLDKSSISSILHQSSNSPSTYGRTESAAIRSARGYFPNQEHYNSRSLSGSLNSGFSGSFPLPQLDYRLPRAGMTSTFDSTRNTEYLDGHNSLDFDRRYHQNSSPNRLQSELRNRIHCNISGDQTSRQTNNQYNSWEPSRPFRPSLAIGTKSLSSPASQYDPILDSIEPPGMDARDYCFSTSQITSFQDASFYPTKTDSWEGELVKNASLHDSNAHAASDIFFDSSKLDVGNSSLPNYEKVWNPDVLVEKSDIKETELAGEWRNLDKNRTIKESKAYRIFHSALVDFVKDLLKPYWRDGHVSKDSHKTIVKKSVEKVLSALQSHQVPSTQEAINQYLAGSKPKLLKLVDGYVHKHANVNS